MSAGVLFPLVALVAVLGTTAAGMVGWRTKKFSSPDKLKYASWIAGVILLLTVLFRSYEWVFLTKAPTLSEIVVIIALAICVFANNYEMRRWQGRR